MQEAEKEAPREWKLFALDRPEGLQHFFPSTLQCRMCGDDPIAPVRVWLDDEGPLWGWYYSPGKVSMIYSHRLAVEVCFAGGTEAACKLGRGRVVRLGVEKLRPAEGSEGIE